MVYIIGQKKERESTPDLIKIIFVASNKLAERDGTNTPLVLRALANTYEHLQKEKHDEDNDNTEIDNTEESRAADGGSISEVDSSNTNGGTAKP